MLNENEIRKFTTEELEMYEREMNPKLYEDISWTDSIGVSKVRDKRLMSKVVAEIGWDAVRERLARETGQDINNDMNYYPPKK